MTAHDDYVARGYCEEIEPVSGAWCRLYDDHELPHAAVAAANADAEHGDFVHQHALRWPIGDSEAVVELGDAT